MLPVNCHNLSDCSADQVIYHPFTERALQGFANTANPVYSSSLWGNPVTITAWYIIIRAALSVSCLWWLSRGVRLLETLSPVLFPSLSLKCISPVLCTTVSVFAWFVVLRKEVVSCLIWPRRAFKVYMKCVFTCVLGAPGECYQLNGLRTFLAWYEQEQTQLPTGITVLRWFSCWVYCTCY